MSEDRLYVECQCGQPEHLVTFWRDEGEILVNVQMSHYLPWWRRVVVAARYVAGLPPRKCHWVDAAMSPPVAGRVVAFLSASK